MVVHIPYELISHSRRICSLYKRWVRNLEAKYFLRHEFRYEATVARVRFDELLAERDMIKAKQTIEDMEEELFQDRHPQPIRFPSSPGGVAFERYSVTPDYVLDFWHPLEKSAYPKYFATRELRKKQFIDMWEKQYNSSNEEKK